MSLRALRGPVVSLAIVATLVLTGCSGDPEQPSNAAPPVEETSVPVESSEPEPQESSEPQEFTQPKACDDILPAARLSDFEMRHLDLLGGPGKPYFGDRTAEELAGGITCVFGNEVLADSEIIAISVAPIDDLTARRKLIDEFTLVQGLNETEENKTMVYSVQGDEQGAPAQLNVLRSTSWISVITTPGGLTAYTDATDIAAEVASQVYR